jgi:hypothetical protein
MLWIVNEGAACDVTIAGGHAAPLSACRLSFVRPKPRPRRCRGGGPLPVFGRMVRAVSFLAWRRTVYASDTQRAANLNKLAPALEGGRGKGRGEAAPMAWHRTVNTTRRVRSRSRRCPRF